VTLNDPKLVREEYATEAGLVGRRAAYQWADGPNALELLFQTVADLRPMSVLEVGCGPGELAERIRVDLGASVVAIDISPRMVELALGRGVDAQLGDVQDMPFPDASFDCAVAAWMLYHVPDVDRALGELARVLRPGGRLVAVRTSRPSQRVARSGHRSPEPRVGVSGDNGRRQLARHFATVDEQEAAGTIRFPDRGAVVSYIRSSITLMGDAEARLPEFEPPFVVRRHPTIFVAEKR
jgi:SAM-dependent methyltransferase